MNILPKVIMALFGVSAILDIAEKIHNWGCDRKNEKEGTIVEGYIWIVRSAI